MNLTEVSRFSSSKGGNASKSPIRNSDSRGKHKIKLEGRYGGSLLHKAIVENSVSNYHIREAWTFSKGERFSSGKSVSPSPATYTPSKTGSITAIVMGTSKRDSWIKGRATPGPGAYNAKDKYSWVSVKMNEDKRVHSTRSSVDRKSPNSQISNRIKTIRNIQPVVGEYKGTQGLMKNSYSYGRYLRANHVSKIDRNKQLQEL